MTDFNIDISKELSRIGREVQELVNKVVPLDEEMDYLPPCDILEFEDAYELHIDLPGLKKEDIKVSVDQNVIRVNGERILDREGVREVHKNERKEGAFTRSFALPTEIKKDGIKASFKHGVLVVKLPKASDDQKDHIPVE